MPRTKRQARIAKPDIARHASTLGDLYPLAGVGPSRQERFAFWQPFIPLKDDAYGAGIAELYRRIQERHGDQAGAL